MLRLVRYFLMAVPAALLMLAMCCISCGSAEPDAQISRADDTLTYGDMIGKDTDEVMEMIENG